MASVPSLSLLHSPTVTKFPSPFICLLRTVDGGMVTLSMTAFKDSTFHICWHTTTTTCGQSQFRALSFSGDYKTESSWRSYRRPDSAPLEITITMYVSQRARPALRNRVGTPPTQVIAVTLPGGSRPRHARDERGKDPPAASATGYDPRTIRTINRLPLIRYPRS